MVPVKEGTVLDEDRNGRCEESRGWYTLSRLFRYPDADLIGYLDSAGLSRFVAGIEELEVEYTRLFITSYPHMLVPPYESWYYREESPADVLVNVQDWYERYGLITGRDESGFSLRADHISVELDFCGYLTELGRFVERSTFIREHLGRWLGEFIVQTRNSTRAKLYRFAVDSLEMWFSEEGKELRA